MAAFVPSGVAAPPAAGTALPIPRATAPRGAAASTDARKTALAALVGASAAAAAGRRLAPGGTAKRGRARAAAVALKARSDAIQTAAAELTIATYPFMKEVPWNSPEFWLVPGPGNALDWARACAKIIDHGAAMDMQLVKEGCEAHHAANKNLPDNGVCTEAQLTEIYATIGRMIASVPHEKTMEVYEAVKNLVDPKVPQYCMSKVSEQNAHAAYAALLKFTEVVKANPITPTAPTTAVSSEAAVAIEAAATKLGRGSYAFIKGVDWTDEVYAKPVPYRSAQGVLQAVDKMIVMGTQMDGAALQEAAKAHVQAIANMDDKGILTEADYNAINAGIGKAISTVPESTVMGVYDAIGRLAGPSTGIPAYLYSMQSPLEAASAYNAFLEFKGTVKQYQPDAIGVAAVKLAKETYPFMKEVDWNNQEFWLVPGPGGPISWTKAIANIIDMGAAMDMKIVKEACEAHLAAIKSLPADGVCTEAQLADIYAGIGRMIASVPQQKTMGVYNAVAALVDEKVPAYLMSKVSSQNAKAAYAALREFQDVVKAHPIAPRPSSTAVSASASGAIDLAAARLGEASYPFMQGVNWLDELYGKPVPGKSPQEVIQAVGKMIEMGTQMDGAALQEAAQAHVAAIRRMDSKGVLKKDDHQAILAGLGKAISTVPTETVMGVYSEIDKLAGPDTGIPKYLYSMQNPADAASAYVALMNFKDTVKACQPDAIQAAAAKLSAASYPFMTQVPWNSPEFSLVPGSANPIGWAKAVGKIIDMGAAMDAEAVKLGCEAHHAALKELPRRFNGVCSEVELTDIYTAIGRMIASVPEEKTMGVYNAVAALVDPKVPGYLMSKVSEEDAKAAYAALLEFTEVVKANPTTPCTPTSTVSSEDADRISAAATELGKAAYPFMKSIDWTDELWGKMVPGRSAQQILKSIDKMIVMGTQMDAASLQEAAKAHVKAIDNMNGKGVLTEADFNAINTGLGKAISSVPESTVMDVYDEMSALLGGKFGQVPQYVYSKQSPADAAAAYGAFMQFKDTVKAAQPKATPKSSESPLSAAGIILLLAAVLPQFMVSVN